MDAPPDPEISTIVRILDYAIHPEFMLYCIIITVFAVVMIYRIAPKYGKKNPLIYLSICSTVGSVSIMAIKAFGIAVKITPRRRQPIHACVDLRLHDRRRRVHSHANELLQQGT